MALAISVFGEDTDDGLARVGEITGVLAVERPDVWFEVASKNASGVDVKEMETARPLHRLRGFALTCERENKAPTAESVANGYQVLEELYDGKIGTQWYPHLVDHADDDGYYVPADFPKPVNSFQDGEVFSVGSSQRLLAELNSVARFLFGPDADAGAAIVVDEGDPFAPEKQAWKALHAVAKASVENNLIIRFRTTSDFD